MLGPPSQQPISLSAIHGEVLQHPITIEVEYDSADLSISRPKGTAVKA